MEEKTFQLPKITANYPGLYTENMVLKELKTFLKNAVNASRVFLGNIFIATRAEHENSGRENEFTANSCCSSKDHNPYKYPVRRESTHPGAALSVRTELANELWSK